MKIILVSALILAFFSVQAQYYYNDIVGTLETNRQMKTYVSNRVKTVSARGIDPSGEQSNDYSETTEVRENGLALKVTTHNNSNNTIFYNRFDSQGRLISIIDSSTDIKSVTTYEYDGAGRITLVQNSTKDTANNFDQTEIHHWIYGDGNKPQTMWRTINKSDSLEIRFIADENGNPGEEHTYRNGVDAGSMYYYYDDKKRLTDVVRYNTRLKKLLPDIMLEYDDNNNVLQKITTTSSLHLGYLIWRYVFDEKGLKTKEALFNNSKELTGKIEYTYTFGTL